MQKVRFLLSIFFVCVVGLAYGQEKNLFKKNTKIETKKTPPSVNKREELDELPPLQFRTEATETSGKVAGSEMAERKFEPIKIVNNSISNFDTTSVDEGENLVVEIEEEAAPQGSEDFVTVASYFSIWDTRNIDPYDIDAKDFDEPVDIELYNVPAGRNWSNPLANVKMTSPFGPRWGRLHAGIDLDLETGYPVFSTFDGIVRISGFDYGGYGNYVVVRHYNGLETLYGHLSKKNFEPGTLVKAGDEIGLGGNTGRSTGSHLHYETRYEGNPFNPMYVFDFGKAEPVSDHIVLTARTFDRRSLGLRNEFGSGEKIKSRRKYWYKVRSGDTLSSIAQKAGISSSRLAKMNGLRMTSTIRPGKRLRLR